MDFVHIFHILPRLVNHGGLVSAGEGSPDIQWLSVCPASPYQGSYQVRQSGYFLIVCARVMSCTL